MHFVIIGDAHLVRDGRSEVARDLAALVRAQRGATIVFNGDLFDLAAESAYFCGAEALRAILGTHGELRAALAEHLDAGGELVLVAGNHDDEVTTAAGRDALFDALGLGGPSRARLRLTPWFARLGPEGALHVEHGHHFDPDNALPHPLAPPDPAWASLGIALMREFIAPAGAHALVHANDGTPMQCLLRAVEIFGPRAPAIIANYFRSAAAQVRRSGRRYPAAAAQESGRAAVDDFARAWCLASDQVEALAARGARPRLVSVRETFLRLYWDRVLASAVLSVAAGSALLGGPGARVAAGAAAVLVGSIAAGRNRYRGRVQAALVDNAAHIAAATSARAVVFGHIHEAVGKGVYRNTGSFAFPGSLPGRPYVVVGEDYSLRHAFFARARAA